MTDALKTKEKSIQKHFWCKQNFVNEAEANDRSCRIPLRIGRDSP